MTEFYANNRAKRRRESDDDASTDRPPPKKRLETRGETSSDDTNYFGDIHFWYLSRMSQMRPVPHRLEHARHIRQLLQLQHHNQRYRNGTERLTTWEHEGWLASNKLWQDRVSRTWRGVQVLGSGGQGIVGLWEYEGRAGLVQVVVKQSIGKSECLMRESEILRIISTTRTTCVVKLLKGYYEDVGTSTSKWDYFGRDVSRIYLEYCSGGDLSSMIECLREHKQDQGLLDEGPIWEIWESLAKGLCVLQNGHEHVVGPRWNQPEILHLDIKPKNILITTKGPKSQVLLADFGLSLFVPDAPDKQQWINHTANIGTRGWRSPEQFDPTTPNRMIGTPSNVWQVASCIYVLIRYGRHLDTNKFFRHHIRNLHKTIETYGQDILQPEFSNYSASLRELLFHCLARDPTERPSPREVLLRCQEQLKQFISET